MRYDWAGSGLSRTIMIMAGGTGGHVFPGLAVAEEMRARGWRVVWLGTEGGMEQRLVPQRGYDMELIRFSGVRGRGALAWVLLPLRLLIAFWQSAAAIFRRRPDVALGMGGYPAFPGGMMAALLARPLAIHEQNSVAGLANRVLARVADRVLVAFPGALAGKNVTLVGNPVRQSIAGLPAPAQRLAGRSGPLKLLVVGGSLGAMALNALVPGALGLIPAASRPEILHQAGARHLEALRAAYAAAGVAAETVAFIEDMAAAYAQSDLVICRAGALTVAELAAAGIASILVPFPHAVDDHQTVNARYLADAGAAILLPQGELTPQRLAELVQSLDRGRLLAMAEAARRLAKPCATREVADACVELAA
jgi:UDP-N-acetylglucosamine--N-acetylmuramyl-(pentapeptide) pyrophosphoryl-undecaprenol N-acetylglucosamine transferase